MRVVEFTQPCMTLAVSVTGRECGLRCAHCGGHYLKGMVPAGEALGLLTGGAGRGDPAGEVGARRGPQGRYSSCLISGGCDPAGKVPVLRDMGLLRGMKSAGLRLNFHTGLVSEPEAAEIGKWADCASFDLVGDDETVAEVFGVPRGSDDYRRSYEMLRRHVRVVPHICIGLRGGNISGEYRAVDYLAGLMNPPDQVVFIVFIPTRGTSYENRTPPDPEGVAAVIEMARRSLPGAKLTLGCMRPAGRYRSRTDVLSLAAGADGVVNPSGEARDLARRNGWHVIEKRECCVF
ncbi:MAG: radical SAM protein [Ignavibacteriales bacterium]